MKPTRRHAIVASAAATALVGATALGYTLRGSQDERTIAVGATHEVTTVPQPMATSETAMPVPSTTIAPPTTATESQSDGRPFGVAAQIHIPLGGASGYAPGCSLLEPGDEGATFYPIAVSDEPVIELLETGLVCFPSLSADAPVDVELTDPNGSIAALVVQQENMGPENPAVPFVDITRRPGDPTGKYTVRATQDINTITATITVIKPTRTPIVDVIEINDDSFTIAAVGFPASLAISVHLYRSQDEEPSTFTWMESLEFMVDGQGQGRLRVPMSPLATVGRYAIITDPASFTPRGRDEDTVLFWWPP
jgi:hypothetical protein